MSQKRARAAASVSSTSAELRGLRPGEGGAEVVVLALEPLVYAQLLGPGQRTLSGLGELDEVVGMPPP